MLRLANFFMRLEARLSYALIGLVQATGYAGGLDLSLYLSLGAVSPLPKMRSSISGPMSTPPCIYEPVYACRGEKFRQGDFFCKKVSETRKQGKAVKHGRHRRSFPQETFAAGGVQKGLKSRLAPSSAPSGRSLEPFCRNRK